MNWSEIIFGSLLVAVLVLVSVVVGARQLRRLRALRGRALPEEEMRWEKRKAWRRLVSSGLTLVMAVLLAGVLIYGLDAQRLADERGAMAPEEAPALTEEEKASLRPWGWLVVALLVVLFTVVMLAGADLLATRRYALRQFRKLQADRRAMIERQATRLRRERNGEG